MAVGRALPGGTASRRLGTLVMYKLLWFLAPTSVRKRVSSTVMCAVSTQPFLDFESTRK